MLNSVTPPSPRNFWGVTIISIPDPYFDHGGPPVEKTFENWQTGAFVVSQLKIIFLQYAIGLFLLPRITAVITLNSVAPPPPQEFMGSHDY